jgi:hypothetical protein
MKPSIGRMVHYTALYQPDAWNRDGFPIYAAIVTAVYTEMVVDLCVFPAGEEPHAQERVKFAVDSNGAAPAGSSFARGKWAWPKREEE